MPEIFNSDYKDTNEAKKFLRKYNTNTMIFALGIFVLVVAIIPFLLIQTENPNDRLIPSVIIAIVGLILIFIGNYRQTNLKEASRQKYTVAALDYIDLQRREVNKIYRRDLTIGILLVILAPVIYFLIHNNASFIPENVSRYISAVLVLVLAVALFLIFNSKGKRDAYSFISENI